ncbi:glycoprotein 3-alpha-L-fucosyltransferase A-like [Physella acuta]|uniref:glycoprotein 3-alpha-L-fucosyltransferase A-like n=1 Tax=Physella acuta TaxID=109671 RepID=UPI0027DE5765|nr:glycoprotein 3-alpha-L-fucosyltransferase A-like [Physella acuta]
MSLQLTSCYPKHLTYFSIAVIVVFLTTLVTYDALVTQNFVVGLPATLLNTIHNYSEIWFNSPRNNNPTDINTLRIELKKLGYEPVEDHEFESPFIVNPKLYPNVSKHYLNITNNPMKIISLYNCPNWFINHAESNLFNSDFNRCEYRCTVDLTGDRKQEADVLIFFVGYLKGEPPARPRGQIWVKAMWESPVHYRYPSPYESWRSVFNWTYTYRVDSDIFAPNNLFAWRDRTLLLSDGEYLGIFKNKTKMAAWWVSHCGANSKRDQYVKELQKYIDVDIYGKCGPLKCPNKEKNAEQCEQMLTTTYKFYLSFENSLCKDYLTEKFYRNFAERLHVIPIARGGFDYQKYIPPGGFVDASQFSNATELAKYLINLGNDPLRYAQMLKEKDKLAILNRKFDWCDICEKVHTDKRVKIIPDIREWSHKDTCYKPTDL